MPGGKAGSEKSTARIVAHKQNLRHERFPGTGHRFLRPVPSGPAARKILGENTVVTIRFTMGMSPHHPPTPPTCGFPHPAVEPSGYRDAARLMVRGSRSASAPRCSGPFAHCPCGPCAKHPASCKAFSIRLSTQAVVARAPGPPRCASAARNTSACAAGSIPPAGLWARVPRPVGSIPTSPAYIRPSRRAVGYCSGSGCPATSP